MLVTAAAALALALTACAGGGSPEEQPLASIDEAAAPGRYGVGVTTLQLTDRSRPTEPNGDYAGADERRLTVEVWYPASKSARAAEDQNADVETSGAPYPLIVFAHGLGGSRRQSVSFTQHLASHGYVVAAPDFPLSRLSSPGGPRLAAVLEQPGDVTFVIDSLLELNEEAGHGLASAIDADRIAVSGHSLGGLTALLVTFGPDRDARVKASLPIAAPACFVSSLGGGGEAPVPTLVLVGSNDLIVPPANARRAYDLAIPPRYYVELAGVEHVRFADVDLTDAQLSEAGGLTEVLGGPIVGDAVQVAQALGGDAVACAPSEASASNELISGDRQRELMRIIGTLFFEAYLRDNADAKELLPQLGELIPEARVESDLG